MASFPPAFFGFMYGITTIATTPMQFVNIPMYNYIQDNPGEEPTEKKLKDLNSGHIGPYFFEMSVTLSNRDRFRNYELCYCWSMLDPLLASCYFLLHISKKSGSKSQEVIN